MDIISEIPSALQKRERIVLATIVSSSGSAPLLSGATLLLKEKGSAVLGTIGGGLLEATVVDEAKQMFVHGSVPVIRWFELDEGDSEEGMICGGRVEVLFELIDNEDAPLFSKLHDVRIKGIDCTLVRVVDSKTKSVKRMMLESTSVDAVLPPPLSALLKDLQVAADQFIVNVQQAHRQEAIRKLAGRDGDLIIQPITGVQSLIVFGGGHIALALSKIAAIAGFTVTIVDDREEYANPSRFPEASRTLAVKFDKAFEHIDVKPSTSIVIVTRGHSTDASVLERAVRTSARYIGMIGSSKKVIATYSKLVEQGVPISLLKRVAAPIGLDISAVSADEIAVSIVAELIQVRRGRPTASATMSQRLREWFDKAEGKQ